MKREGVCGFVWQGKGVSGRGWMMYAYACILTSWFDEVEAQSGGGNRVRGVELGLKNVPTEKWS